MYRNIWNHNSTFVAKNVSLAYLDNVVVDECMKLIMMNRKNTLDKQLLQEFFSNIGFH